MSNYIMKFIYYYEVGNTATLVTICLAIIHNYKQKIASISATHYFMNPNGIVTFVTETWLEIIWICYLASTLTASCEIEMHMLFIQ